MLGPASGASVIPVIAEELVVTKRTVPVENDSPDEVYRDATCAVGGRVVAGSDLK